MALPIIESAPLREAVPRLLWCSGCRRALRCLEAKEFPPDYGVIERHEVWGCFLCGNEKELIQLESVPRRARAA